MVKLLAGPDEDIRRDSHASEHPMSELRPMVGREVGGWDDDHDVVIAVCLSVAASA